MMKYKFFLPVICFVALVCFISVDTFHAPDGPHGGTVKEAGNYKIEMKSGPTEVFVYLLDKKSKPLGYSGISCDVRFFLPDSTSMDIHLVPYEKDGFSNSPGKIQFSSCRVIFDLSGEKISALFENQSFVAKKE